MDVLDLDRLFLHEAALRRLALALCHNHADAEDAVQHALAAAALGKARNPSLAFLRTAVRNHLRNLRKLATRRRSHESAVEHDSYPAADEPAARNELRQRVAAAVLALAEPYRTTVWMRWFEDLSAERIARDLAIPLDTVRTRLQRGHEQLRRRLDAEYGDRRWMALAAPWGTEVAQVSNSGHSPPSATLLAAVGASLTLCTLAWWAWPEPIAEPSRALEPVLETIDEPKTPVPTSDRRTAATDRLLSIRTAEDRALANAPIWLWQDSDRPLWAQRARPGRRVPGIDVQRDQEPPTHSATRTDDGGRLRLASDREAPRAISVRFTDSLWFTTEIPADGRIVLPPTTTVRATMTGAPDGATWEGEFALVTAEFATDSARCDVTTPSGRGVVWVATSFVRGPVTTELSAIALAGREYGFSRVLGHGFVAQDEWQTGMAPHAFDCTSQGIARSLEIVVLDGDRKPTRMAGYAVRNPGLHRRTLDAGRALFDSDDTECDEVRVRLVDGQTFRRSIDTTDPLSPIRVEFTPADAIAPHRLRLPEPVLDLGTLHAFLEDRPSNPFWTLGSFAHPNYGHGPQEFGRSGDGEVWFQGLSPNWKQLILVSDTLRIARCLPESGPTAAFGWEPSAAPIDIDVATYLDASDAPPRVDVSLEVFLPYVVMRSYGDRHGCWQGVRFHARDPQARVLTPPPIWRRICLPTTMPWRLRVVSQATESTPAFERVFERVR